MWHFHFTGRTQKIYLYGMSDSDIQEKGGIEKDGEKPNSKQGKTSMRM